MSPLQFVAATLFPLGLMSHLHADPDVRNSLTATEIAAAASAAAARAQQSARDITASTDRDAPVGTRVPARDQDAPAALGGAVFSPFADAPVPPPAKTLAEDVTPPASRPANAGFGLTLVAAAGASAALFWLLRRS